MDRRRFLETGVAAAGAVCFGSRPTLAQDASEAKPVAERFDTTVDRLTCLPVARRRALAENAEGKTAVELNATIPEIAQVELDNSLSDASVGDGPLRVIAWNIERGREWEGASKLIQEHAALQNPDLIMLSEMDIGMARSGNKHTTREMAQVLGMNYAYAVEFLELSLGRSDELPGQGSTNACGYHGNAILSRFPLTAVRMLRFPGIAKWYGSGEHRLGGRNAVVAEIESAKGPVLLISTHLESGVMDGEIRDREVGLILDEVDAFAGERPIILGGDLNSLPTFPPIERLRNAGFDVDNANDLESGTAQRVFDGEVRLVSWHIDYIAVRGARVVHDDTSPKVVLAAYPNAPTGKLLSDHAAVTALVQL